MEEGKVDRLKDVTAVKLSVEDAWGGNDLVLGTEGGKSIADSLYESRDQLYSESSIPLSPQWLYVKPTENKDARPLVSSHRITLDSVQKDPQPQEFPHEKKERKSGTDVESSHRWLEEERESSLLGRRERKKEGDREVDFRRSDTNAMKDVSDSRALPPSERWSEGPTRNLGNDGRRDGKWSSRWGPEDKEREFHSEKKVEVEKDDTHAEKQSSLISVRPVSESDSRDKWRPRHRQEGHSGGSATYRAAPGFGLEKGRSKDVNVGFSVGRGRGNLNLTSSLVRASTTQSIGAPPFGWSGSSAVISELNADIFRYPRGKLLDIFRQQKIESIPDALDKVPSLVLPNSVAPLAFVTPCADEEALLMDIRRGMDIGGKRNHVSNDSGTMDGSKIDIAGTVMVEDKLAITTGSLKSSLTDSGLQGEFESMSGALTNNYGSSTEAITEEDVFYDTELPDAILKSADKVGGKNVLDDPPSESLLQEMSSSGVPRDNNFNLISKLSSNQSIMIQSSASDDMKKHDIPSENRDVDFFRPYSSPEEMSLFYLDPQGAIQGPFLGVDIISWFEDGYFGTDLPVCPCDAPAGSPFCPLGEVMPQLVVQTPPQTMISSGENSEVLDVLSSKVVNKGYSDFGVSMGIDNPTMKCSNPQDAPDFNLITTKHETAIHSLVECQPPAVTSNLVFDSREHYISDGVGWDNEEVLYTGRSKSSFDKSFAAATNGCPELFQPPSNPSVVTDEHAVPRESDLSPLGLSWSELKEMHNMHPLSSNTGNRASQVAQWHDQVGVSPDGSILRNDWLKNNGRNGGLKDAIAGMQMPAVVNTDILRAESQLMSHQRRQHINQDKLQTHQSVDFPGPFMERVPDVPHRQATHQQVPEFDHIFNLHLEAEQRHHHQLQQQELEQQFLLQQLQQQQQQQQQQQLRQQHRQQIHQQQLQLLQQHQQKLLLEQMMHQQLQDHMFPTSHDQNRANEMAEQLLLREHLLNEMQQEQQNLLRQHDAAIEQLIQAKFGNPHQEHHGNAADLFSHPINRQMLTIDQQLLGLQQDQLQAHQLALPSRHQPATAKDNQIGVVRSFDESGQLMRPTSSLHMTRPSRHDQLDLLQSIQGPSMEHHLHVDQNLLLQDKLHRGSRQAKPIERHVPLSQGHFLHTEHVDALSRLHSVDSVEQQLFASGLNLQQQLHPERFSNLPTNLERPWSEPRGQLLNSLESHLIQREIEVEKQRRDMAINLQANKANAWPGQVVNEGDVEHMLRKNMLHRSLDFSMDGPMSYGQHDSASLFPQPHARNSFSSVVDRTPLSKSLSERPFYTKRGQGQTEGILNYDAEKQSSWESGEKASLGFGSLLDSHFLASRNEVRSSVFPNVMDSDLLVDQVGLDRKSLAKYLDRPDGVSGEALGGNPDAKLSVLMRQGSLSGAGTGFADYDMISSSHGEDMTDNRSLGAMSQLAFPSDAGSFQSTKLRNFAASRLTSEDARQERGVLHPSQLMGTSSVRNDARSGSHMPHGNDIDALSGSFMDMLTSTKKSALPNDADAASGAPDSESGGKSKKKGKKGKQIDPSLLGFKVHSNRIMMGEIHHPNDL